MIFAGSIELQMLARKTRQQHFVIFSDIQSPNTVARGSAVEGLFITARPAHPPAPGTLEKMCATGRMVREQNECSRLLTYVASFVHCVSAAVLNGYIPVWLGK